MDHLSASKFTVDVVSPQFPCGAAWLANALLELEVPLPELWGFDTSREWAHGADGASRYIAEDLPWRQTLASLRLGRVFTHRRDVRPRFSHFFPWQFIPAHCVVLIVRDPRDALYSEWQRHRRNLQLPPDVDLPDFLQQPFFSGPISMVDMLWLHLGSWLALRRQWAERIFLLRFEDWKHDPVGTLGNVARWMGLSPSDSELACAAAASDVRHLQEAEIALRKVDSNAREFNRRGMPLEWHESWKPTWHAALGPHWQRPLQEMNYSALAIEGKTKLTLDMASVFAWHGLKDPAEIARWTRILSCWSSD